MPPDIRQIALAKARIEQARSCLAAAESLVNADLCKDSANRSYYCIFHAMRAVLALDGFDSKRHSGIISAFRQRYVKTDVFSHELSKIIENAFDVRNNSDYEDFYVISKSEVKDQLENAKIFLLAVEAYLKTL
ncbi:MAG: HEPN domain-containing protein [Clostridiales Family XIII bacterium]|jgi:uncharacterized protein (UPF0332 family)|nr:HEPN domain-containing protein [Clostridiales Family XIII bacterium]